MTGIRTICVRSSSCSPSPNQNDAFSIRKIIFIFLFTSILWSISSHQINPGQVSNVANNANAAQSEMDAIPFLGSQQLVLITLVVPFITLICMNYSGMFQLLTLFPFGQPQSEMEIKVEVLPLGVQIITSIGGSKGRNEVQSKYNFLPHEDILDVIISEVVLSYKVFSCVFFRVRTHPLTIPNPMTLNSQQQQANFSTNNQFDKNHQDSALPDKFVKETLDKSISHYMKEGKVQLVPAFPGLEMTYKECETLWEQIMIALGKLEPPEPS